MTPTPRRRQLVEDRIGEAAEVSAPSPASMA